MTETAELNVAMVLEATAGKVPERVAVISAAGPLAYAGFAERCRRLARYLSDHDIGCHAERDDLAGHEVGQDLLAQYLVNGPEYLEGLIGSFRARVAPFNVNYRYVPDELRHLLLDAQPAAIIYHERFAPVLAEVLPQVASLRVLLQVADGSGHDLLPGAIDYEEALASVPAAPGTSPRPDDLYVLYTGGTTGSPKGVLWRQADIAVAGLGLVNRREGREWASVDEHLGSIRSEPIRFLAAAPFMHGAAQWGALQVLCEGNTVVIPPQPDRLDAGAVWETVAEHRVGVLTIVGDAFARPMLEELEQAPCDVSSVRQVITGGAPLGPLYRERLLAAIPGATIVDTLGSSEAGIQARRPSGQPPTDAGAAFHPGPSTLVISEDLSRYLEPGHEGLGWLATRGRIPLGYLGDPEKTAKTFPVVGGYRISIPGDRARLLPDGRVELLGRDSMTVNTGGEKVFVEEVESVLKTHPAVADAVVCGRPSARWGSEVVAVVALQAGYAAEPGALVEHCASRLARYKLPKAVVFVDSVRRSPAGKPDYQWAVEEVTNKAAGFTRPAG